MSQVTLSTSADVANYTAAHKLMAKSRRGSGLNVANLAAYSQLAANEGLKLNRVAVKSRGYMQSDLASTAPVLQTRPVATFSKGVALPAWNARLSGVMVGMLVAMAVGSQASSSISSDEEILLPQGIPTAEAAFQAVSTATSAQLETVALIENVATQSQEIEQPEAKQRPDDDLLLEMQAMIAQQSAMEEQLDMLDYVNLALNKELLQMELTKLALEEEAQKNVEVRTVYNFINVPVATGYAAPIDGLQLAQVSEEYDDAYYDQFEADAYANDYE